VVEIEGGRVLAPACSRKAEDDMVVKTDSERVRHSRKMVMEFLGSSVDLSITPPAQEYIARYDADLGRYGPPAPPDTGRDRRRTGHHEEPDGQTAATVHQPVKVDKDLYVRDYSKCILCYKCVDACGDQWQNTFAITVAGRGFDARISTEYANPLPDSACVYCGNCIAVCPTGALMFASERAARRGAVGRGAPDAGRHRLSVLRRGLQPDAARPGQPDRQGQLTRRPRHHPRQPLHQGPLRLPARAAAPRPRLTRRAGAPRAQHPPNASPTRP
jgi:ferredoxin